MRLNPPTTGLASAIIFLCASAWGIYWIPLRMIDETGVTGGWSVVALNAPAALVLGALALWGWRQHRGHIGASVLIGLASGLALSFYALGLVHSSVVRVTLLFYLTPVWATLIGIVWLGERATWRRWAAIAAGLMGLVLLLSGGGSTPLNIADALALLSGMLWAVAASLIMSHPKTPIPGMTAFQFAVTAIAALAIDAAIWGAPTPSVAAFVEAAPVAVTLSVLAFVPAVALIFWAQKFLFPGRAGLLMMSEVLVAVLTASLLIPEETMSPPQWIGAALVIGACLLEVLGTPAEDTAPA